MAWKILRTEQRRQHQESVSPPKEQFTGRICLLQLFWNSGVLKTCYLHRRTRTINLSISALSTVAATHPTHSRATGGHAPVSGAACIQLAGAKVGKKDPVLQILGICALIAFCCFWLQRCKQADRLVAPPPTVVRPSLSSWSDFQGI